MAGNYPPKTPNNVEIADANQRAWIELQNQAKSGDLQKEWERSATIPNNATNADFYQTAYWMQKNKINDPEKPNGETKSEEDIHDHIADPDEYWENVKKYNHDELEKLNAEDEQDENQAALDKARAYNEAHADEMYENWREGQGLEDDEEGRTPGRIEGMYSNPDGEYYKGEEHKPGRIEGMYSNPDGEYYKGDETEARWRAFYENRGEPLDDDDANSGNKDPNNKGSGPDLLTVIGNKKPGPDSGEDQPKTKEELEAELDENEKRQKEIDEELLKLNAEGLIAVNANVSRDRNEEAADQAKNAFNAKLGKSGFFKKLWMNYFEKYYKTKYKKEILAAGGIDIEGQHFGIDNIIEANSKGSIGRVVKSVAENEMSLIHDAVGEKRTDADEATTEMVRQAIIEYANARGDNADEKLFTAKLQEQIAKMKQEGNFNNPNYVNNFFEVAENAIKIKELLRNEVAMENVLEKFAVYNAEVYESNRTKANRDIWDKAIDKWENSKLSRFISPETVAAATSIVSLITKSGANAAARMATVVGGVLVSGGLAGVKERRRVTNDRETMMRNLENGVEYNSNPAEAETRAARKRAKYEAKIGGTTYQIESAKKLTSDLIEALESNDENRIMEAYAAARVRTDFSDSERKGLISYSAADKRGTERLALDTAMIEAKRRINASENESALEELDKYISDKTTEITKDVDENDANFKKVRAAMVAKKVAKTIAIGAATFIISQEAIAALSDRQVGILEKLGVLKTQNQVGAKETILASAVKSNDPTVIKGISADNEAEIRNLEQRGYKRTKVVDETTTTRTTYVEGDPATSAHKAPYSTKEWLNNGTEVYDGNELRAEIDDKYNMVTTMHGTSTAPISGRTMNFEEFVQNNRVKGLMTINGTRFEAVGTVLPNGQVRFITNGFIKTPYGDIIQAIDTSNGNKLYEFFEIGGTYGKDPTTGLIDFMPAATDVGVPEGSGFTGMFQTPVTEVIETSAIYDFTLPTPEVTYSGIIVPDLSAREGIGNGTPIQETDGQGGQGSGEQEPTQAPTPDNDGSDVGQAPAPTTVGGSPTIQATIPDNRQAPAPNARDGQAPAPAGANQAPAPNARDGQAPAPAGANQAPAPGNTAPATNNQPNANSGQGGENRPNQARGNREQQAYTGAVEGLHKLNRLSDETARVLLETPDGGIKSDEEYKEFYNNLSDSERELVNNLYSRYATFTSEVPEGKGFMDWLKRRDQLGAALAAQQAN